MKNKIILKKNSPSPVYSLFNGAYVLQNSPIFTSNNRSFKYGDNLFETIVIFNGFIPFLDLHLKRLQKGMAILQMQLPNYFSISFFEKHIKELNKKNQSNGNAIIRLTVFRKGAGKYLPETCEVGFILSFHPIPNYHFQLNTKGLHIDFFSKIKKPINILSNIKHGNALLYILAALEQKEKKLGECLLLNEKGNVIEAISSSIFIVKKGHLITPPLSEGGVDSIMRQVILNMLKKSNKNKIENITLTTLERIIRPKDLEEADEIWLTNAVRGVQWVEFLGDKSQNYGHQMADLMIEKLNKIIKPPYFS